MDRLVDNQSLGAALNSYVGSCTHSFINIHCHKFGIEVFYIKVYFFIIIFFKLKKATRASWSTSSRDLSANRGKLMEM